MIRCFLTIVLITIACSFLARAQQSPKTLIATDSLLIDSNPILNGSVKIWHNQNVLIANLDYKVNYYTGYLYPSKKYHNQAIQITYQASNLPLTKTYRHKSSDIIIPKLNSTQPNYSQGYTAQNNARFDFFKDDELKLMGSISRGVGVGNNQDAVVSGNLNLQMAGKLGNDLDVLAAISDENNPIQPEGNTQQLQDFDKVFVQVSKNQNVLTVGDFEMAKPVGNYFLNYYKKSRGIQVYTPLAIGKNKLNIGAEAALSRGRFARNTIRGIEGNQGPYRLSGTNGELFILIISGTEAIYVDGQKLTRGEQNDYVIDYNTGEITFMAKRPINQYSRIVAEFQYSDRNYARTIFHVQTEYVHNHYNLRLNYFTEQDNKNQPFLQTLTDTSKKIMADVGDNITQAFIKTETPTTFDGTKILYRKTDSLGFLNVYVYAAEKGKDSLFYDVRFTQVGAGKGNYKQGATGANGRVYVWVEPIAGMPQGDYEPVQFLITPKRQQMLTLGVDFKAIKNTLIQVEVANSNNDLNTYSTIDKNNDAGYGFKTAISNTQKINQTWQLKSEANYEYVDANFRYVERYRNVEFDRTWNRQLQNVNFTNDTGFEEHIGAAKFSLFNPTGNRFYYQLGLYNKQNLFKGIQHLAGLYSTFKKNIFMAEAEWLNTNQTNAQTNQVNRYRLEYNRIVAKQLTGVKFETENSLFYNQADTLTAGSFGYNQWNVFIKNTDSTTIKYKLEYLQRTDELPANTTLTQSTLANQFNGNLEFLQKNGNRFSAQVSYRKLTILNQSLTPILPEQTLLNRVEYDYAFLRRVFVANTYYLIGKGQELRRDFQYIEVQVGLGQYLWKDFNADEVQQLNEFVLAGPADRPLANYIRVLLPTNSTININLNQFSQTLQINPAAIFQHKKGIKKIIGRFTNLTAYKTDRKTSEIDLNQFINPFALNLNDSALISLNNVLRNTLFFNRSNPTFGADYTYQVQTAKTLLTNGFESRKRLENNLNTRWNLNSSLTLQLGLVQGVRTYLSDFFSTYNYQYNFNEIKPRLIYQLSAQLRFTALASIFKGVNTPAYGNETSTNVEYGGELRYSLTKQGVVNAKLSYYKISYNGETQTPLGYDMLQGLNVGKNAVWNVNLQQRLGNSIQININYDGRISANQNAIHTGRVEARYLF